MSSSELLELEEEVYIPMEYSYNDGQKGKTAMNTILELGKTLLHSAREGDTMSVIDLMSKGAPFTTDWLGTSPLHLAAMNNHLDTCETLLRAGIGKDAKTKVERSPLHFAAYEGHTPIVQLLLQHKAEVDCRDMLHMTPLHWAVERQHEACAVLLVQAGADPAAVSRFHKTPMSIAEEMGWDSMWEVLHSAHQQRSKESINNTAQAVEGISGGTCLRAEDMIIEPDILEDDGNMGDHESETHDHIENILPKVTHSNNEAAVQMLREHGIMMIPHDNTNTVTSAVQSGRKIVLSDAGKLMLKDISETPKGIEIMKKEGQGGKGTNAKIYTMSSSQFLAIAGQNKNNILKKIPINTNKPLNSNTNVNRLKTLPVLKAININRSPTKTVGDNKTISPYKGRVISINSFTKLSDELMNVKAMASQGRAKVIQLKNASNLGKTVKIVVKNTGSNQKFVIPKISSNNSELISSSMNATTALSMPALSEIEPHNTEVTTMQKQEDVETLKKQLAETREELETYKKKFQILEDELNLLKNTHHMIQTTQEEPELVTQVVETGYDSTEMDATTEEHEFVDTQEPEFVDTQEVEYSDLANESVIDTTIVESELDTSEMESG